MVHTEASASLEGKVGDHTSWQVDRTVAWASLEVVGVVHRSQNPDHPRRSVVVCRQVEVHRPLVDDSHRLFRVDRRPVAHLEKTKKMMEARSYWMEEGRKFR